MNLLKTKLGQIRLKSLHYMSQVESLLSSISVQSIPAPCDQTRPSENEKKASLLMVAAFRCVVSMVRTFWMSLTYLHFLEKDSTDRGPKKTFENQDFDTCHLELLCTAEENDFLVHPLSAP